MSLDVETPPAPVRPVRPSAARVALLLLPAVLAGTGLLLAAGGSPQPVPAGLPDPGPLTGWALPATNLLAELLGILVVGSLLVPLLTMTRPADELRGSSKRAVGAVRWLASAWALTCLVQAVLTVSDLLAVPVWQLTFAELHGYGLQVDQGRSLLVQVLLALVLAVSCRWILTVRESMVLLVVAVVGLLPPVLTGHSASSGSHDTAIISLALHIVAIALWTGGVLALWWHLGDSYRVRALAARRFAGVAAWCFGLTAVTGVVNAAVRLGSVQAWFDSAYGRGALVKVLTLGVLGLIAMRIRATARGVPSTDEPAWRRFAVLTGVELAVMSVAVGLGVALSRTPPPVGEPYTSVAESVLGGPVPPPPTLERFLFSFTPSGVGFAVVGLGVVLYLVGVHRLHARGDRWPVGRTVSWMLGLALVAFATCGGLGTYAHVLFSAHMASHMMLSMMAPILLVLGNPVTLALRTLPGSDVPGGVGPKQLLSSLLQSRFSRVATHPAVVAILFVGSLYGIYFSGIFDGLMQSHLGHGAMELHFLLVGFLYFEILIGDAPVPHRLPYLGRLMLLLVVAPFHAFFAIALMSSSTVVGGSYYELLDRGFATDLLADQQLAGSMTWALGEVPMVLVLLVLVFRWSRSDRREAARSDRRADRDGDAELAAYNEMLARLAAAPASGSRSGTERQEPTP